MSAVETGVITTKVPARLDRLPWAKFHWMIILGLGTAWVLDGLEVTIVGTVASRMTEDGSGVDITAGQIGIAGSIYVVGAVLGALVFGQLTDRFGRKKLFMLTLALYVAATAATALTFSPWYFYICRFLTGAGIGGEYAAVNSAIDELIPARARGRVDLVVNGAYWLGSAAGSAATIVLLNTAILPEDLGWRLGFALGVLLAIAVLGVRRHVPESPRWLFIHGREDEAERIVGDIEEAIEQETGEDLREPETEMTVRQRKAIPFREIARVAVKVYPKRSLLALALFVGQAFIYNGITFNLGTLITTFYDVSSGFVPVFIIMYAFANFLGPVMLGHLFDTVGRKPMISGTYLASAALGVVLALLFTGGALNRWTFIGMVMVTFFFASAGASAAYLTASEIFPMETRALAIAFFYAVGTAVGGISGPLLFGRLIGSGDAGNVAIAFYIGSAVMAIGGITEIAWGIKAEQQQLEDVARPLTAEDAEDGGPEAAQGGQQGGDQEGGGDQDPDESSAGRAARRARALAAEERARQAEHVAAMHQLRAAALDGDDQARGRAQDEEVLARVAELVAQGHDEEAGAAEAEGEADDADDEAEATAARTRAAAGRERAAALFEQARALTPERAEDAERHEALAEAARERARAQEQRAEAVLAAAQAERGDPAARDETDDGAEEERQGNQQGEQEGGADDVALARQRMHEAWADVHEARAHAHQARAWRAEQEAGEAEHRAALLLERAQAAEALVEAAEHRVDARRERPDEDSEQAQRRRRQEQRERAVAEQRARAILRQQRPAGGAHRLRLGPGGSMGSPAVGASVPRSPELLAHERRALERALDEHGPTSRAELRRLVGARYWGPGVFGRALAEAVEDGGVRRVGRNTYAAADGAGGSREDEPAGSSEADGRDG